jgi:hypothetical protein
MMFLPTGGESVLSPSAFDIVDFSYGCRGGVRIDSDVIRDITIAGLLDKVLMAKAEVGWIPAADEFE